MDHCGQPVARPVRARLVPDILNAVYVSVMVMQY